MDQHCRVAWLFTVLVALMAMAGCSQDQASADEAAAAGSPDSVSRDANPGQQAVNSPVKDLALPAVPAEQLELHGSWRGEPFWIRLSPHNDQFGGRILKVVYTADVSTADSLLDDHPWLLLDSHLRLIAWNERSKLSAAQFVADADAPGYEVIREVERRVGDDVFPDESLHTVPSSLAWPQEMVPALLALCWRADGAAAVDLVDVFAEKPAVVGQCYWRGERVVVGEQQWTVVADADGRLQTLTTGDGDVLLQVAGREAPLAPVEAFKREQAFMESLLEE